MEGEDDERVPRRWMAPESLDEDIYTEATDVVVDIRQHQLAIIQNGISVITLCTRHQPEKNELILPFSLYKHFVSSGHLE